MKNLKLFFTFFILTSTLISCKCFKSKASETMTNLENTSWQLVKTQNRNYVFNEEKPDGISISFTAGNFSSSDGCNALGGEYKTEGNSIEFGPTRGTMRYCDQEFMEKFGYYVAFHLVKKFEIKNNKLYLYDADGQTLLAEYSKK
ncbi:META domain-containing protein [Flavobacterium sp. I3-2]|uniref:META domain-containing protein n=1 Tax=Flavobacterium sp. I3-2 TaxID=2748319 RepID=UPI0015A9064B|nr:META domain-containing protein [Flavobacterium sp. I3-2]